MEDVLSVYKRPYEARYPVVCMDEMPKQLLKEVRQPLPPGPGQAARYDYEYERNGVTNVFLFCEPLLGQRTAFVRERRTKQDWAHCVAHLLDRHYAEAEKVVLVMDNLNTHRLSSLYETFPAAKARRLAARLEIHYTPEHGSWLNMAEIELSILSRQCLSRRLGEEAVLRQEIEAWVERRNARDTSVDWRFTTEDARIKLKRLYPKFDD